MNALAKALAAEPSGTIMGDVAHALAAPPPPDSRSATKAEEILEQHGFGKLTGDDLTRPLGWSLQRFRDEYVPRVPDNANRAFNIKHVALPSSNMVTHAMFFDEPTYDLTTFAATYRIDGKTPWEYVIVYPNAAGDGSTCRLNCDGEDAFATYTGSSDIPGEAQAAPHMQWVTSKGTYLVGFYAKGNPQMQQFSFHFSGTLTSSSGSKEAVSATQDSSYADYGSIGGIVWTLFSLGALLWQKLITDRSAEKAAKDAEKKIEAKANKDLKRMEAVAERQAKRWAHKQTIDWKGYGDKLRDQTSTQLDKEIKNLDVVKFKNALLDPSTQDAKDVFKNLHDAVKANMSSETVLFVNGKLADGVDNRMDDLANSHLIEQDVLDSIRDRTIAEVAKRKSGEINLADANTKRSLLETYVDSLLATKRKDAQATLQTNLLTEIGNLQLKEKAAQQAHQNEVAKYNTEVQKHPDVAKRTAAEAKAIQDLKDAVDAAKSQEKTLGDNIEGKQKERDNADLEEQREKHEAESREAEAKERHNEVFK